MLSLSQRPITLGLLLVAGLLLAVVIAPGVRRKREEAFQEA